MTARRDFTTEDWDKLLYMPWIGGLLVINADESIRFLRELMAMAKAVESFGEDGPASVLIGELVADMDDADPDLPEGETAEVAEQLLEELDTTFRIIRDTRTPDEADHLRSWVLGIAQATAEAQKEGGFLGIGGVRISDAEQAILDRIDKVLSPEA